MSFEAKYHGRCGICDDKIELGDECHYVDDEVCHIECDDE
jgi:hypothetical protein